MRCMCCTHFAIFHGPHGCTAGESSSNPCKCPGYEAVVAPGPDTTTLPVSEGVGAAGDLMYAPATYVEGRETPMEACEMPASSGGAEWVATVEACARAACEAHPSDPEWAISTDAEREMWRKVARAVLAAAGRGVR